MPISVHQVSSLPLVRTLSNLAAILEKAKAHAEARGIEERVLLEARLFPDMFPLVRQVQIAVDVATRGIDRLAGQTVSSVEDTEASFSELIQRIRNAVAHIERVSPEALDGAEDRDVSFELRGESVTFNGQHYLLSFVWPNVFFHVTTAYAILRHSGVELGKRDYLGNIFG